MDEIWQCDGNKVAIEYLQKLLYKTKINNQVQKDTEI
jgi:hypothetical protein